MKTGRRGCALCAGSAKEEVEMRFLVVEATRSIMEDILSSSSGQMSGQWVKPK